MTIHQKMKTKEPQPKLHEQWDGCGRPEQWELLQRLGESTTWAGCRYSFLPASVKRGLKPELEKWHADAVAAWKRGEI